ncbi:MAG: hypothetical protein KGS72_01885 [Cyanobacteria bacterium REEB67]|nr:hypothetical protein [Cyanobacteria bacterium REEB67]
MRFAMPWGLVLLYLSLPLAADAAKADLQAVKKLPLATGAERVHGVLGGKPFVCEQALINSYSIVLRQNHGRYARLVLKFSTAGSESLDASGAHEYYSKGDRPPRLEMAYRNSRAEKLELCDPAKIGFALHLKLAPRQRSTHSDTTNGAIVLRLANGDFLQGSFTARQSPRVIWDTEQIEP